MSKILVDKGVLEQALEALKCVDLQSLVPDYGSGHYSVSRLDGPQVKSAITVIEAALAEPVQEPDDEVCDGLRGGMCIHQDPNQCKPEIDCPAFSAPSQRKPLTEEEMYIVEEEARKNFCLSQAGPRGQMITYWDSLTPWLIRAVEQAHEIGE